ncbi:MAG: hypothetical protein AABY11_00275 [archaeon]
MDFIHPEAFSRDTKKATLLYPSAAALPPLNQDSSASVSRMVFLPSPDLSELQRCASQKISCMVSVHSLAQSFDVVKHASVSLVYASLSGAPVIDFAWMSLASQRRVGVVFSLHDLRDAFVQKNVNAFAEYRKVGRLVAKSALPLHIASFARTPEDVLSSPEQRALLDYLEYFPTREVVK